MQIQFDFVLASLCLGFFYCFVEVPANEGFDHRHHQVDKSPNKQIIGQRFYLVFVLLPHEFLIQRTRNKAKNAFLDIVDRSF